MSEQNPQPQTVQTEHNPPRLARRKVLERGAKLAYVAPVVLVSMRAAPADAAPPSGGGGPLPGFIARKFSELPESLIAWVHAAEHDLLAA